MNKADPLFRWPDHKKGIPSEDKSQVLLDSKFFLARATQPTPIALESDSLQSCIKKAQAYDSKVSQALETILKNGPHSIT